MSETPPAPPPAPPVAAAPPPPTGSHSFTERLFGALRLEASIYDEVEHDEDALGQAAGVVAIAAVCAGIGGAVGGVGGLVTGVIVAVLGWVVSAAIVWLVGVRIMEHTSSYPELLRTIGFAQAPQILLVVAAVPVIGWVVRLAVFAWGLAAYVVAVRQALDVETGRAILVCVLAWGVAVLMAVVFGALFGGLAG